MAGVKFDASELEEFNTDVMNFLKKEYPKEVRNFMQREGNTCARTLRQNTKMTMQGHGKNPGSLIKGIRRGRAQKRGDDWQVRVKNSAPHATFYEKGHVKVVWGKHTDGFVEGRHPAAYTQKVMKKLFPKDVDEFIDKILKEGFR